VIGAEVGCGRHAWPEARWPARDREAWAAARLVGDPLDADGPAGHWRPPTVRLHVVVYGLWLDHLDRTGELDPMLAPGERATAARLQAFITELQAAVAPVTVAGYLANLAGMIQVLDPSADLTLLRQVERRLAATASPQRNKCHRVVDSGLVFAAALRRFRQLQRATAATPRAAHDLAFRRRDALILALLAARPVRLANLAMIRIGQHLRLENGGYVLHFTAQETKQKRPLELALPAALSRPLQHYLQHDRPLLLGANASEALWITVRHQPMAASAIYCRVVATSQLLLGQRINPHLLRDCAVTALTEHDPEALGIGSRLLGHASRSVTRRAYDQGRMLVAQRRHVQMLQMLAASLRDAFGP